MFIYVRKVWINLNLVMYNEFFLDILLKMVSIEVPALHQNSKALVQWHGP